MVLEILKNQYHLQCVFSETLTMTRENMLCAYRTKITPKNIRKMSFPYLQVIQNVNIRH